MTKLPITDVPSNPEKSEASLSDEIRGLLRGLRKEVHALREEVSTLRGSKAEANALLTREEAAERLRISTRTLDDLEASGRLQAVRIGRRVLYHPDTLDAYVRSCTGEGGQQ